MATTMEPEIKQRSSRAEPATPANDNGAPAAPGKRRSIVFGLLGVALLALIAGGVRKFIWARTLPLMEIG